MAGIFTIFVEYLSIRNSPFRTAKSIPEVEYWPALVWQSTSLGEQGLDSAIRLIGLEDIHRKEIAIDSLLKIRNDYMILSASSYPTDGRFPHDVASVKKSVMTTVTGIMTDRVSPIDQSAHLLVIIPICKGVLSIFPAATTCCR